MAGIDDRYVVWAEDRPHLCRSTSSWIRAQWWLIFVMGLPALLRGKRMRIMALA